MGYINFAYYLETGQTWTLPKLFSLVALPYAIASSIFPLGAGCQKTSSTHEPGCPFDVCHGWPAHRNTKGATLGRGEERLPQPSRDQGQMTCGAHSQGREAAAQSRFSLKLPLLS